MSLSKFVAGHHGVSVAGLSPRDKALTELLLGAAHVVDPKRSRAVALNRMRKAVAKNTSGGRKRSHQQQDDDGNASGAKRQRVASPDAVAFSDHSSDDDVHHPAAAVAAAADARPAAAAAAAAVATPEPERKKEQVVALTVFSGEQRFQFPLSQTLNLTLTDGAFVDEQLVQPERLAQRLSALDLHYPAAVISLSHNARTFVLPPLAECRFRANPTDERKLCNWLIHAVNDDLYWGRMSATDNSANKRRGWTIAEAEECLATKHHMQMDVTMSICFRRMLNAACARGEVMTILCCGDAAKVS